MAIVTTFRQRSFIQQLSIMVTFFFVVAGGCSILTGNFVPLQSSRVEQFGICTQNQFLKPVIQVDTIVDEIYICGSLQGSTKRRMSFRLFYGELMVFRRSGNWNPGEFFIPLRTDDLMHHNSAEFPVGNYQLDAAYARDAALSVEFEVVSP